jgi:hypothetical protein
VRCTSPSLRRTQVVSLRAQIGSALDLDEVQSHAAPAKEVVRRMTSGNARVPDDHRDRLWVRGGLNETLSSGESIGTRSKCLGGSMPTNTPSLLYVVGVALALSVGDVWADCASLAKWGIYDTSSVLSDDSRVSSFSSWFCSSNFGSNQEAHSASASVGVPIEDLPVKLGWDQKDSSWRTWENNLCSTINTNQQQRNTVSLFLRKVNPAVIAEIAKCQAFPGVHAYLTQAPDPRKFVINLSFTPFSTITSATLNDVIVSPSTSKCQPSLPLDGSHKVIWQNQTLGILCERPSNDSVMVVVNADRGVISDSVLTLAAIPSGPPPKPALPSMQLTRFCATGDKKGHAQASVTVPSGYKIIGGGAQTNWSPPENGNFLTASFPVSTSSWMARSKDHSGGGQGQGGPDETTITTCVVAMRDPNDEWDVRVFTSPSPASAPANLAVVTVPNDYLMTGGGAELPDDPVGQLLFASFPSGKNTWTARSHDKYRPASLPLTAYAIGIKPRNGASLPNANIKSVSGNNASQSAGSVATDDGWKMTGGGAWSNFGGEGNFLYASVPSDDTLNSWTAKSSDQGKPDPLAVNAYLIELQVVQ